MKAGLILRRINIRQVVPVRTEKMRTDAASFRRFKKKVDETINQPMLQRLVPMGTILKDVYLEIQKGKNTFGRQMGSYPLLVCLPYQKETGGYVDVKITEHGYRSVTGVAYPLNVNTASLGALTALPSVGEKRAARIIASRPYNDIEQLQAVMDDEFDIAVILDWCHFR
jgi:radical SAM superfamily enzyme with C-terminal helix-hairpin-helix motif